MFKLAKLKQSLSFRPTRVRIVAFEHSEDTRWLIIVIISITDDVTGNDYTGWRWSGVTNTDEKMCQHQ